MNHSTDRPDTAGFTLLEILIVLALLGLLVVVLTGTISFGISARGRVSAVAADGDDLSSLRRILVQQLGRTYPDWVKAGNRRVVAFDGSPDDLEFLAPSLQAMGPGLAHYRLELDRKGGRNDLLLRASLAADSDPASLSTSFAEGLAGVKFSYFGSMPDGTGALWQDDWAMRSGPPDLVAILVTFPRGDNRLWPLLIIHPEIDAEFNCEIDVSSHSCAGH